MNEEEFRTEVHRTLIGIRQDLDRVRRRVPTSWSVMWAVFWAMVLYSFIGVLISVVLWMLFIVVTGLSLDALRMRQEAQAIEDQLRRALPAQKAPAPAVAPVEFPERPSP